MSRVTLNGINRVGLSNWKAREKWNARTVRIWSAEHGAWWRPNCCGYTDNPDHAGLYSFADAYDATKHCGPEKRIAYEAVPDTPPASHDPPPKLTETDIQQLREVLGAALADPPA